MASVSSLDQDMRNLRLGKYTPQAANEVRTWMEQTLGEPLPPGDLLRDALKDGVVLCKLANLALPPPGIKFKKSPMPFIQMENISHFLRVCEAAPFNMPAHDRFLTVDLFESKDPAQVLQCIGAFSRVASQVSPQNFPTTLGPKRSATMSPASTGAYTRNPRPPAFSPKPSFGTPTASAISPSQTGGSTGSHASDTGTMAHKGPVSSWAKSDDRSNTSPAWNIAQYGYMGGASQGNQGVMFGGRRQITTAAPHVPGAGVSDYEKRRREKEAEEARLKLQAEEAENKRKIERHAEEERDRIAEEQRWEEESRRVRDEERQRILDQKREWEEQERKWKAEEEARHKEEEAEHVTGGASDGISKGRFLSQHQADQSARRPSAHQDTPERRRVRELEQQLEEARERERQYQLEREGRVQSRPGTAAAPDSDQEGDSVPRPPSPKDSDVSWAPEGEYLQHKLPEPEPPQTFTRPLPTPSTRPTPSLPVRSTEPVPSLGVSGPRPLPDPSPYRSISPTQTRTDRFLAENPAPVAPKPATHQPAEMGYSSTYEEQADRDRRIASQQKTKAAGWASKSLLEREMERERERQREWEANQQATKEAARDVTQGTGAGHQYGYMGGDSQNRGGNGIGSSRRQIIGPRPPP